MGGFFFSNYISFVFFFFIFNFLLHSHPFTFYHFFLFSFASHLLPTFPLFYFNFLFIFSCLSLFNASSFSLSIMSSACFYSLSFFLPISFLHCFITSSLTSNNVLPILLISHSVFLLFWHNISRLSSVFLSFWFHPFPISPFRYIFILFFSYDCFNKTSLSPSSYLLYWTISNTYTSNTFSNNFSSVVFSHLSLIYSHAFIHSVVCLLLKWLLCIFLLNEPFTSTPTHHYLSFSDADVNIFSWM